MLEDKYQGNHQFINYGNQIQNSEVRNKLDQIHHIIHDTYEHKIKNVNQSNYQPSQAGSPDIQSNEVVQQQVHQKSANEQKLEDDYVKQFQVHQRVQQQIKQQTSQLVPQEVDGYQPQQQVQAQADLSPTLEQGNFQIVQSAEKQIAEHQHKQQVHQQQQHQQQHHVQQQQQVKEALKNQYINLPTNMTKPPQKREQVMPQPYRDDPTIYAQFKGQQQEKSQQQQQVQQQAQQQLQQNTEILNKKKKDDINILIILVIFAIIFLF